MINFFKSIGKMFADFGKAVKEGDIWTRLSLLFMGVGYIGHGQVIKGVLVTLVQAAFFYVTIFVTFPYLSIVNTTGTAKGGGVIEHSIGAVERDKIGKDAMFNPIYNDYDNSLLILLVSIMGIALIVAFIFLYVYNMKANYSIQLVRESGKRVPTFRQDLRSLINEKFHITLLTLPGIGVLLMNVLPIIFMVCIAFTNYDATVQPPNSLLSWVGWRNFGKLFGIGDGTYFSYAFVKVLIWTLVWAVLATVTTYIGGIMLAMLINHKDTKLKPMWRTLFVITIAIPQFVTLLLISKMFSDTGIVNTICKNIGLTQFLYDNHIITSMTIPFMSAPGWAHVMIVLINIWVGVPYQMLIATGILMNIPDDQLESARIDGANKSQIFWKIKMPYMLFITGPSLVTSFIGNINNFNVIFLLTNGYVTGDSKLASANAKETDLLITWLFSITANSTNKEYYMASVIGIFVFILCATLTLVVYSKMIKGDKEEVFQ